MQAIKREVGVRRGKRKRIFDHLVAFAQHVKLWLKLRLRHKAKKEQIKDELRARFRQKLEIRTGIERRLQKELNMIAEIGEGEGELEHTGKSKSENLKYHLMSVLKHIQVARDETSCPVCQRTLITIENYINSELRKLIRTLIRGEEMNWKKGKA